MITKKDMEKKIKEIQEIHQDRIKKPKNIPVGIFIQEAENLYNWCQQDKEILVNLGLPWELVIDLPTRCEVLKEMESNWITQRFTQKESIIKWKEQAPDAYDLRDKLLQNFRFAFRSDPELMEKVRMIARGESHADMIQDLIHLNALGKQNPDLLANINFDMSLLDIAIDMSKQLRQSLAEATADKNSFMDDKKIRDQAYTHLKEAVDQIYEYGQFAFRHTPDRRKGYKSNYMYVQRQKTRKNKQVSTGKDAVATAKEDTA